jgi:predicted PurR-regulated permease PerM
MLPFIVGTIIAYLLLPLISWAESKLSQRRFKEWQRAISILVLFLAMLILIGGLAIYVFIAVAESVTILYKQAPQYFAQGVAEIREWFDAFYSNLSPAQQQQLDVAINNAGTNVGTWLQDAIISTLKFVPGTFSMILGFAGLPLFMFYLLKDSSKFRTGFYSFLSPRAAMHARNIFAIMDNVLGRYIRSQVLLGAVVAIFVFIGLTILGIRMAPALAVVAGIGEFIPTIGPWIAGIIGVIVALALVPDKVLWVAGVYLIVQLLENLLLVPRIRGGFLRINPALLLVILVLGSYVAGIWGMVLFPPLTALIVELYKYVRQRIDASEKMSLAN